MPQPNSPVPPHHYAHPTAGRIRMEVHEGYPVAIHLYVDGRLVKESLDHRDLSDLAYVIARAKDRAREKLGQRYREV